MKGPVYKKRYLLVSSSSSPATRLKSEGENSAAPSLEREYFTLGELTFDRKFLKKTKK